MAMSDAHKEALARGRRESRALKDYLGAIAKRRPGRPVTAETLAKRLAATEARLEVEADPLKRVELQQKILDTENHISELADVADIEALEQAFIAAAPGFSDRKGISYAAWRAEGVPAAVLKKAGISRNS